MKTIWRKLPTLKFNPPQKNKKEGEKIPTQNTWNAQYKEEMKAIWRKQPTLELTPSPN
jgi:hypothetical protein